MRAPSRNAVSGSGQCSVCWGHSGRLKMPCGSQSDRCPVDVPFSSPYCTESHPTVTRVMSGWEAVHPSEVLCGIFPFVLTFPFAGVRSAQALLVLLDYCL